MVSQAEYARTRGVSRQYVHTLVKQGRLMLVDGLIDTEAADRELANKGQVSPNDEPDYWIEKARHERARARLAELELAEKERLLIPFDECLEIFGKSIGALRAGLLMMPTKLAGEIVGLESIAEAKAVLEREIHQVLTNLSKCKPWEVEVNPDKP